MANGKLTGMESRYEELKRKLRSLYEADLAAIERVAELDAKATGSGIVASETRKKAEKAEASESDDGAGRGEILSALRESLKHLDKTFTWKDALGFLKSRNSGVDYKDTSVRQAVTRLVESGEVIVSVPGRGRRLSVYKRRD